MVHIQTSWEFISQHGTPSRDWLNPNLGYITTSRARAKIVHWFKLQARDQNVAAGKTLLERELARLGLPQVDFDKLAEKANMKIAEDMFAALGAGDLRLAQLVNLAQQLVEPERGSEQLELIPRKATGYKPGKRGDIQIQGVGNLMTQMAGCCQPLPGDAIVGYITQGRGVSIHRQDCASVLQLGGREPERIIQVSWGPVPVLNEAGEVGFRVLVGGGLGRTPVIGAFINEFLPWQDLLSYLEAILRVYNRYGRRDNKYKARIKILVKALTPEVFAERVEAEMVHLRGGSNTLTEAEVQRIAKHFVDPDYKALPDFGAELAELDKQHPGFARWRVRNTLAHKKPGYVAVTLSLKPTGVAPGDVTDKQWDAIADMADRYSFGQLRTSHEQNIILADVEESQLFTMWGELRENGFATPNIGLLTDMICCPGGDFCSLANAKSIPIAESIQRRFENLDYLFDIGELDLNISGCMNACGHHHVGHIGILGVDKKGAEFYQVSLGGSASRDASLGKILGPSFAQDAMPDVIEKLIDVYVEKRNEDERFIDTYQRIGIDPFKERVYAANN